VAPPDGLRPDEGKASPNKFNSKGSFVVLPFALGDVVLFLNRKCYRLKNDFPFDSIAFSKIYSV